MAKEHQTHEKLEKPNTGYFGRNEWAIIGAPCDDIRQLAGELIKELSTEYKVAFIDANHENKQPIAFDASMVYTNQITHRQLDTKEEMDEFSFFPAFNQQDILLVNGNHFTGQHQIVIIDQKEKDSLSGKMDRLTDVQMILLAEGEEEVYPFLASHLRGIMTGFFSMKDTKTIAAFIRQRTQLDQPPLYGLVLAGGKSSRMGKDKGEIDYHGKPQREYAADLLSPYCEKTFISCREDQLEEINTNHGLLPDTFLGLGPYGGILSAFQKHPNAAWMVVACDLPFLDKDTLDVLVQNRAFARVATCFKSVDNDFPEPLISILEPKSYLLLLQFLARGSSSLNRLLTHSDITMLPAPKGKQLRSVDKPEDWE